MKYILAFFIVTTVTIVSCKVPDQSNKAAVVDDKCQKYYDFLKENIRRNEGGWYEFVSEEAIYQKYDQGEYYYPFGEVGCFGGADKAFIRAVLGEPHREISVPHHDFNVFIYCFHPRCYSDRTGYEGLDTGGIIVRFDEHGIIREMIANIGFQEEYRKLDRNR